MKPICLFFLGLLLSLASAQANSGNALIWQPGQTLPTRVQSTADGGSTIWHPGQTLPTRVVPTP